MAEWWFGPTTADQCGQIQGIALQLSKYVTEASFLYSLCKKKMILLASMFEKNGYIEKKNGSNKGKNR